MSIVRNLLSMFILFLAALFVGTFYGIGREITWFLIGTIVALGHVFSILMFDMEI